jgi:hypothetical protein
MRSTGTKILSCIERTDLRSKWRRHKKNKRREGWRWRKRTMRWEGRMDEIGMVGAVGNQVKEWWGVRSRRSIGDRTWHDMTWQGNKSILYSKKWENENKTRDSISNLIQVNLIFIYYNSKSLKPDFQLNDSFSKNRTAQHRTELIALCRA